MVGSGQEIVAGIVCEVSCKQALDDLFFLHRGMDCEEKLAD